MAGHHEEHRVLVAGADEASPAPGSRRRRGVVSLIVPLAVIAALVAVSTEGDPLPTATTLEEILPPRSTPSTASAGAARGRLASVLSDGWHALELPGSASLTEVAHGGDTWVAVAGGGAPAVWVSSGAVTWTYRPLPAGTVLRQPEVLVSPSGQILLIPTIPPSEAEGLRVLTSSDGGASWQTLETDVAASTLRGAAVVGDRSLLFGSDEQRRAVVWVNTEGSLQPMPIWPDPGAGSEVAAVIDWQGTGYAFGRLGEGPAAWMWSGEEWRRIPLEVPESGAVWGFGPVVAGDGEAVGVLETAGGAGTIELVSEDLIRWEQAGSAMLEIGALESVSGGYVGRHVADPGASFSVSDDGREWEAFSLTDTVTFDDSEVWDLAFAGEVGVVVGARAGRPTLWTRGAVPRPEAQVPKPSADEGQWVEVALIEAEDRWYPFATATNGDDTLLLFDGTVYEVDFGPPITLHQLGGGPFDELVEVGGEIVAWGDDVLALWDGDWIQSELPPFGWVCGVTVVAGDWIVFGELGADAVLARSADLEHWEVERYPAGENRPAFFPISHTGGMFRWAEDGRGAAFSRDGRQWTQVEGELLWFSSPVLVLGADGRSIDIRLLEDGLAGSDHRVPFPEIDWVDRVGEGLLIGSRGTVHLLHPRVGWQALFVDLVHGVEGHIVDVLEAPDGSLVALDSRHDGLHLLRWVPPP